jgi:hypothetical protein
VDDELLVEVEERGGFDVAKATVDRGEGFMPNYVCGRNQGI